MSISTTKLVLQQTLKDATNVIIRGRPTPEIIVDRKLGEGGYNEILNEVASISMIFARCLDIPVPKIYTFSADGPNQLVAQEYIDVAQKIAEIIVDMAETRFSGIGGFSSGTSYTLGPTVEGSKLFKGRGRVHSNRCYPIGPYKTIKEYTSLAMTKRYITTPMSPRPISTPAFSNTCLKDFVQHLRNKRRQLDITFIVEDELSVLVHGDFHGRNIIMQGSRVQVVLDWEFADAYPLGELLGGMRVDVLEVDDEESDRDDALWSREIQHTQYFKVTLEINRFFKTSRSGGNRKWQNIPSGIFRALSQRIYALADHTIWYISRSSPALNQETSEALVSADQLDGELDLKAELARAAWLGSSNFATKLKAKYF
ncbi:hypothetical protein EDB19DRAFT_1917601 [Suillus lakei]|nr:hypothetical protein EDB19DRAFT_1917601 [Suillus lakei]